MRETCLISAATILLGASVPPAADAQAPPSGASRSVAITVDDVPGFPYGGNCEPSAFVELNRELVETFAALSVPVTGFVVEGRVCPALAEATLPEVLSVWLDAGMTLGNHTYSHPDLNTTPVEVFQRDVQQGERVLRRLLEARGRRLRYFRFPMLHSGRDQATKTAMERYLTDSGYQRAPVTIDNQEFVFANAYLTALQQGEHTIAECVATAYVPFMEEVVAYFEERAREVLGYELPQILLLHANELNAAHVGEVLDMFRGRGYRFVSLETALTDSAYARPDPYVGPRGLSWIHRLALAEGIVASEEPRDPSWVARAAGGDFTSARTHCDRTPRQPR